MTKVFVDTVAWIALVNTNDVLHSQALRVMETLRQQSARLVTTEFVLLEVADALCTVHSLTNDWFHRWTATIAYFADRPG